MLTGTAAAAIFFLGMEEYSAFFEALRKSSAQISNFYFAKETDYFAQTHAHSPLLHTWSLAVEEQFYLLWPLLLLLTRQSKKALLIVASLSLGLSEYLVRTDAMQAFYLLHARAWELALGGLVALNICPKTDRPDLLQALGIAGLGMIAVAILALKPADFPGLKALLPCVGTALILYAGQNGVGAAHRFLSIRPLVWTGMISYSLYLWHWPIIAIYKNYTGGGTGWTFILFFTALSFALAYLSWRFVEQPFRKIEAAPWKIILCGFLTIVIFILFGNIIKKYKDASWRVTYTEAANIREPHALDKICSVEGGAYDRENCIVGPDKDSYQVILSGDSHASHYAPAVLAWAAERGLTVRLFMRGACRVWVDDEEVRIKAGKRDQYCMDLSKDFFETVAQMSSIQYVFLALHTPGVEEVQTSLDKIKNYGKRTYYLGQTPVFKDNPHQCQIRKNLLATRWFPPNGGDGECLAFDHDYSDQTLLPKIGPFRAALQRLGIPYFDPVSYLQDAFDEEGRFMYLDSNHMNRYGAAHLARPLAEFIRKTEEK